MSAHLSERTSFVGARRLAVTCLAVLAALGLLPAAAPAPAADGDGAEKDIRKAVDAALAWVVKQQDPDGRWRLDGNFADRGQNNDTAGTAFGLLPLLRAGHTHKPARAPKDPAYTKAVAQGLKFLLARQDKRTGNLGGGMYAHALAALALCRAYEQTQDPMLRPAAQRSVDYLVMAQHEGGGWRYAPGQPGDTSVTSWQVQALETARKAGLQAPARTFKRALAYLDSARTAGGGYTYIPGSGTASASMTAAALTCRLLLQKVGAQDPGVLQGVNNYIALTTPGATRNVYLFYYAARVMRPSGAEGAKAWNEKLIRSLLQRQVAADADRATAGSWPSTGDAFSSAGGRLMVTSFSALILQDYLPQPRP